VAYALQFVGNPYVWGGNSLTNGVDCSGFVHEVYAHFGISTPRYSQSFKTAGQPVSYNNMKAGDVVVYPGHVAIYIGNGLIVEAQSTKAGITSSRSVNCHTITAIRRLL
jgi:cell wall-associated NlpC family hydrolase